MVRSDGGARDKVSAYGVLDIRCRTQGPLVRVRAMVEKPKVEGRPRSNLAVIGRYILDGHRCYEPEPCGQKGAGWARFNLTDAIAEENQKFRNVHGFTGFDGSSL